MANLNEQFFNEACKHLVGGVNSPVRAYKSVGGTPPFITKALGAHIWDANGTEYIDYVGSWGPAILGHAHPQVVAALNAAAANGLSFGAPTLAEVTLAAQVKAAYPSIDLIRFVNSGTEAVMGAIRVARGFTGRKKIIKFDGCYHGHADYLLVKAGSGAQTLGTPDSAGVPSDFTNLTLVATFNNLDSVENLFTTHKDEIACVIIEPIIGNMGCILPDDGFLKSLRELTLKHGALLIFDEVMTGFRVHLGGAQKLYNIKPDLTCLGKIIGGGLPVGAYGGRKDIMEQVAPLGGVYQAGTLSGNPLAMAVGGITLKLLNETGVYQKLDALGRQLEDGIRAAAKSKGQELQFNRVGSMFSFFFSDKPVKNADDARRADTALFKNVFHHLLGQGIYLAPSAFEAGFISLSHTTQDIEKTAKEFAAAL